MTHRMDIGPSPTRQKASGDWIVVLAKQPIAGHAKTRLARDIGDEPARALAEAFVLDTLALSRELGELQVLVAYSPSEGESWFKRHAIGAELYLQPEGPFEVRIHSAIREAFLRGARRCVLIGTDTPHLQPETLQAAFEALGSTDVCLGPAEDGGYYLIGVHREDQRLFIDVPWSTETVHEITLQRAREAGLTVTELPPELDVDEGSDLEGLVKVLVERPRAAASTRAAVARLTGQEL